MTSLLDGVALALDTMPLEGVLTHEAVLKIDTEIYGPDAVRQACYAFTDRCFFQLQAGNHESLSVYLRRKSADDDLDELLGEFANELLDQRVRIDVFRRTHALREMIVAQAFAEADLGEPEPRER